MVEESYGMAFCLCSLNPHAHTGRHRRVSNGQPSYYQMVLFLYVCGNFRKCCLFSFCCV